jgi:hypothetical protein
MDVCEQILDVRIHDLDVHDQIMDARSHDRVPRDPDPDALRLVVLALARVPERRARALGATPPAAQA